MFTWRSSHCASAGLLAGLIAAGSGACGGPTASHAAVQRSSRPGWGARVALAIDVHAPQSLADFPVPIRITPDRFDLHRIAADGHDLRFTDSAGVDLPFEVEAMTPSHGGLVWVRVPALGHGATRLEMYFDNPKAPYLADRETRNVWRAGFTGVFHCIGDGIDSSPAAAVTGVVGTNPADGVFGEALYFATQKADALTATLAPSAGDRTLCAWVRPDGIDGIARIAGATGFALDRDRGSLACNDAIAPNALAVETWRYACCVHHHGFDAVFVDGVATGRPGRSSDHAPGAAFEVGGRHGEPPAKRFAGVIDEVRVSSVARDAAWLAAETATKDDVVTFGAIENL